MKKEAGVATASGAILGGTLPVIGAAMLGNKLGKKKYNLQELKAKNLELESKVNSLKKEMGDFSGKKVYVGDAIRDRINSDEYANLTVGQAANKLYNELGFTNKDIDEFLEDSYGYDHDFVGISKKAGFKNVVKDFGIGAGASALALGPILAPISFAAAYSKNKQDKITAEKSVESNKKELDRLNQLSNLKKEPQSYLLNAPRTAKRDALTDYQADFGGIKSALVDAKFDDHGFNSDVQMIDDKLRSMGYNVNNMNFKQYKDIVNDVYNNALWKDDEWQDYIDDDFMKKYKKGNDKMNKQANQIVDETFEKLAEEKRGKRYLVNVGAGLGAAAAAAALSTKTHKAIGGGVSAPGAIYSLATGLGAIPIANAIQKKRNTKKGTGNTDKQAYEIVDETFEKMAGIKDLFGAAKKKNKSAKQMIGDLPKPVIKNKSNKLGKGVALGLGAAATAAGVGMALKKKKDEEEKTAFDIVDETFDKVAGIKNFGKVLTGKNVRNAQSLAEESATALGFKPKEGQRLIDGASDFMKRKVKEEAKKTRNARLLTGTGVAGAGAGAGVLGARSFANKKEKTAFDIVDETFEKQAGIKSGLKNFADTFKGTRALDLKAKLNQEKKSIYGLKGSVDRETMKMFVDKYNKMNDAFNKERRKTLASWAGVGAAATLPPAIIAGKAIINKIKKNKEEKTAFDIVDETFEKVAKAPSRDEETRTRYGRDLFMPGVKRLPAAFGATLAGGIVQNKINGGRNAAHLVQEALLNGRVSGKTLAAMTGGAVAGKVVGDGLFGLVKAKKLKKLNEQYGMPTTGADLRRNYGITPALFSSVSDASIGRRILHPFKENLSTPEAIVQAKRRKLENQVKKEKKAFDIVNETFEKVASNDLTPEEKVKKKQIDKELNTIAFGYDIPVKDRLKASAKSGGRYLLGAIPGSALGVAAAKLSKGKVHPNTGLTVGSVLGGTALASPVLVKETKKQNDRYKQKLIDLGLDESEIKTRFGLVANDPNYGKRIVLKQRQSEQ